VEGRSKGFAFSKDGDPRETSLKAFQSQFFEKCSVAVKGNAPLFIVVPLVFCI